MRKALAVFDAASECIAVTGSDATSPDVSDSFTKLTGYATEGMLGKTPRVLESGVHDAEFYRLMWTNLTRHGVWRGQIWNRRKSGEVYPELLSNNALKDDTGENFGYVAAFSDITSIKCSVEELRHLAFHDTLTDLPNRIQLRTDLQRNINLLEATNGALVVVFVDLDGFKTVTDTYGHQFGVSC
jgi:PAS domain S-box-containing protein